MLSNPQINGAPVLGSNPATTGLTKNGPKRRSYSELLTRLAKVRGAIARSSRSRYILVLYRKRSETVATSVASPVRPRNTCSPYWKTLGKLLETVRACTPRRRSQAMATQSLPTMATQAPPFIEKGEDWWGRGLVLGRAYGGGWTNHCGGGAGCWTWGVPRGGWRGSWESEARGAAGDQFGGRGWWCWVRTRMSSSASSGLFTSSISSGVEERAPS